MKIPHPLHQFENESALVIVSGAYDARIFMAKDGSITQKKFEQVSTREDYSDREGFWRMGIRKTKKDTGQVGTWSVYEHHKEYLHEKFLHYLREDTFDLFMKEKLDSIYLFAPHYIARAIIEHSLHPYLRSRIVMTVSGDYHYHSPVALLKIITAEKEARADEQQKRVRERLRTLGKQVR